VCVMQSFVILKTWWNMQLPPGLNRSKKCVVRKWTRFICLSSCACGSGILGVIKGRESLDKLSNWWLHMKDSALWCKFSCWFVIILVHETDLLHKKNTKCIKLKWTLIWSLLKGLQVNHKILFDHPGTGFLLL
jgi:hypothetical protein